MASLKVLRSRVRRNREAVGFMGAVSSIGGNLFGLIGFILTYRMNQRMSASEYTLAKGDSFLVSLFSYWWFFLAIGIVGIVIVRGERGRR